MADLYRAAVTGEAVEVQRLLDAQADVTYNLGDKVSFVHVFTVLWAALPKGILEYHPRDRPSHWIVVVD